jgi:hypothetical protein
LLPHKEQRLWRNAKFPNKATTARP